MRNDIRRLHEDFCLEASVRNYRPSTIRWWRHAFRAFVEHFPEGEISELADMDRERLRRYLYGKRQAGWTAHTFSNQYRALRAFLSWAVREGLSESNPLDGIERPRLEKKLPKHLTLEQARRVLDAASNAPGAGSFARSRDRAMLGVMVHAGLRSAEALGLRLEDIDLRSAMVLVRCGKGAKDRIVPMSPALRRSLLGYLKERERAGKRCPSLFTTVRGDKPLSRGGMVRIIEKVRALSGVHFSAHRLRHTFATLMLEGECGLFDLQQMMGHANIQTTTVYLHASAGHLRRQIVKHPLG